jgi:hypothetical protein
MSIAEQEVRSFAVQQECRLLSDEQSLDKEKM